MSARRVPWAAAAFLALGAAGIAFAQPRAAREARTVRFSEDAVVVPGPAQLEVLSLGYRAATVDVLWAKLVLEYGTHVVEKRPFPEVMSYVDGVVGIEPGYANLYRFVDTLILYGPSLANADDARTARKVLERGTEARPKDADVWLKLGQFLVYLSPTFLTDESEINRWRRDGAIAMGKAVELGADPDRAVSAGIVLDEGGERAAAAKRYQAAFVHARDPASRVRIFQRLLAVDFASALDVSRAIQRAEDVRRTDFPFLKVHGALLVGPSRDPAACAGAPASRACPRDWSDVIAE